MELDDLKISDLKQLLSIFGTENRTFTPHIGKKCIIRTYASGVHFGELVKQDGRQVELKNSRRLWKWHATDGISLSEVANTGIDNSKSKICAVLPAMTITDCLEIIPALDAAIQSIECAKVASK